MRGLTVQRGPSEPSTKGTSDGPTEAYSPPLERLEEAVTVLFCLIDDAYATLNARPSRYESIKRLSDSEVITLALFQQLRGVESERSFLRDCTRFFSQLFPGVTGMHPSSFHRRVRNLRRFVSTFEMRHPARTGRRTRRPGSWTPHSWKSCIPGRSNTRRALTELGG